MILERKEYQRKGNIETGDDVTIVHYSFTKMDWLWNEIYTKKEWYQKEPHSPGIFFSLQIRKASRNQKNNPRYGSLFHDSILLYLLRKFFKSPAHLESRI